MEVHKVVCYIQFARKTKRQRQPTEKMKEVLFVNKWREKRSLPNNVFEYISSK